MYAELSKRETEQFERRAIVAALGWLCDPLRTMDNFQVGDIVQLKAGGPTMSIRSIERGGERAICDWFDGEAKPHYKDFYLAQLKKVEPPQENRAYIA